MAPEITPGELRNAEFRTTLRGWDRVEVESILKTAASQIEALQSKCSELEAKLADSPVREMTPEFEQVGKEVTAILEAAREAAEAMRERASIDSARWRREATEEADTARKEAAADAEALRRDAWVTGSELLEHTAATAEAMRAAAERDVLTVMGEAEREAHRLTSGSRREAEDMLRNANMEAEKIVAEATKRRDEIIDNANRQAATAQERARALELRRDELLEELENVRSTLTRLEGSLEERREALDLTRLTPEDTTVRVVHPAVEDRKDWELGETVRVVPKEPSTGHRPDTSIADEVSDQVARIQEPKTSDGPPPPVVEREVVEAAVEEAEPVPPEPDTPETAPAGVDDGSGDDDVGALFASLRGSDAPDDIVVAEEPAPATEEPAPVTEAKPSSPDDEVDGTDWIAERDTRLLPITNRALRGVKKAMTEVQNVALDSLRTDDTWTPDEAAIADSVHAELVAVWSESFAAGHSVAESISGEKLKRPSTPASRADRDFAADLAAAVRTALEKAGEGQRERQSAASRVFRVWRSDEAERRIRDIAVLGYETAIEKSRPAG